MYMYLHVLYCIVLYGCICHCAILPVDNNDYVCTVYIVHVKQDLRIHVYVYIHVQKCTSSIAVVHTMCMYMYMHIHVV